MSVMLTSRDLAALMWSCAHAAGVSRASAAYHMVKRKATESPQGA